MQLATQKMGDAFVTNSDVMAAVTRLERKVDALIAALAEEDETAFTLDGDLMPGERDKSRGLG